MSAVSARGCCSNRPTWTRTSTQEWEKSRSTPRTRRSTSRRARNAARTDQGGDPRSAHGGRRGEHLRRRGALARAGASTDAGERADRRRGESRAQRDPRRHCRRACGGRARRSATTSFPTARAEPRRTGSRSTDEAGFPVSAAARRSTRSALPGAAPGTARRVRYIEAPARLDERGSAATRRAIRPSGPRARGARARCSRRSTARRSGSAARSSRR